jgi:hypothetical protein
MTYTQLCANSSSYEITQWIAYFKIKAEEMERERKRDDARMKSGGQRNFSIFDVPER